MVIGLRKWVRGMERGRPSCKRRKRKGLSREKWSKWKVREGVTMAAGRHAITISSSSKGMVDKNNRTTTGQ